MRIKIHNLPSNIPNIRLINSFDLDKLWLTEAAKSLRETVNSTFGTPPTVNEYNDAFEIVTDAFTTAKEDVKNYMKVTKETKNEYTRLKDMIDVVKTHAMQFRAQRAARRHQKG